MTKGTPNEPLQYNPPPLIRQLMSGEFKPLTIALPRRETYVWMRLGGIDDVRAMIAPNGICAHCAEEKIWPDSYHGWFCYTCHRDLDHLGLLPSSV